MIPGLRSQGALRREETADILFRPPSNDQHRNVEVGTHHVRSLSEIWKILTYLT